MINPDKPTFDHLKDIENQLKEIVDTLIPDGAILKAYQDQVVFGEAIISLDPDAFKEAGIKVMSKYGKALKNLKER